MLYRNRHFECNRVCLLNVIRKIKDLRTRQTLTKRTMADPHETHDGRNRAFNILYLTTDMLTLLPDTVNLAKSCVSITGVTALLSIVMFVKAVEKFDLM
ncbi:hypothetical protein BN2127_JRS5_01411 [Bacillus amyloliquefaciens]|nr:hypothetical protein BN2127_JRS5_01411 [Bacillus amyloliquefaciens]